VATAFLCKGLTCDASDEPGMYKTFLSELKKRGLSGKVDFIETGCQGLCEVGPIVQLHPLEAFYCRVKAADVAEIIDKHIVGGQIVERLLYAPGHVTEASIPFYSKQVRRVLSNTGKIDPENIDEYIARDGYKALYKALKEMTPEAVIADVLAAGLRGRGGGGFPTGKKWEIARAQADGTRYIVCNADEGDPGAFMDRSLLEGDPHRVLEGILIAAYAIGAEHAFIYCRAEYPLAIRRLEIAMAQARLYGLIGPNILGTGKSLHVEIVQGAGAFVCGEETAMISSIEGKRGMARNKPPYPAQHGFSGHPTCVNNVETFANVPLILAKGVAWFRSVGTEKNAGTKIFSLSGKIKNTGLVEVPMGITMRELLQDIGGGAPEGSTIKGAQTGGPSGGCIPADRMDCHRRLRKPAAPRRHDGLGRPGGHRFGHLHGELRQVLPGIHPARIVWQVHSVPRRHQAHARDPGTDHRRQGQDGRHHRAAPPGPGHLAHLGLRAWGLGAQPGGVDPALLRARVRLAHQGQSLPGRRVPLAAHLPHPGQLPRLRPVRARLPRSVHQRRQRRNLRHRQRPLYQVRRVQPGLSLRRRGAHLEERRLAMTDVNLTINDLPVSVPAGSTILEAAQALSIRIPTLCYDKQLTVSGACRMCVVEVANPTGSTRLEPSCSFPVQEGMKVRTNTRELRDARRTIIELILANHPRACQTCIRNERCSLQSALPRILARQDSLRGRKAAPRHRHLVGGHHAPPRLSASCAASA
jgi:NADH:ubiquinone oxidoreductase subunit F (NADH-binding)/(2Fe-2S) ferredoxin/ferredoxin